MIKTTMNLLLENTKQKNTLSTQHVPSLQKTNRCNGLEYGENAIDELPSKRRKIDNTNLPVLQPISELFKTVIKGRDMFANESELSRNDIIEISDDESDIYSSENDMEIQESNSDGITFFYYCYILPYHFKNFLRYMYYFYLDTKLY
ncbi:hypothetical protein EON71_00470 [bacterium]|nr:MAG: hypothetical protein EON71_00470 [bacterium]